MKKIVHKQAEHTPDSCYGAYVLAECGRAIKISIWNNKLKKYYNNNNCVDSWEEVTCKNCLKYSS